MAVTLVYFAGKMIYEDKRAYLYDDSFRSNQSSLTQIQSILQAKVRTIQASLPKDDDPSAVDIPFWSDDPHLFQINSFHFSETGYGDSKLLYKKKGFEHKVRIQDIPYETVEFYFPEAREKKIAKALFRDGKSPPRIMILAYLPTTNTFLMFDFIVDQILEDIFETIAYDMTIMSKNGQIFYNNHPQNVTTTQSVFYKDFVAKLENGKSGVKEVKIDEKDFILSYMYLDEFSDYYILGAIQTAEAYEITRIFIANTVLYAIGLIGMFNILAIFLARSVTNPLDKITKTIQGISEGNYSVRVEPQKIPELAVVGKSFNIMVEKIQEYNEKLREYNRSLEQKVEDRTKELRAANVFIQAMVDSLSQGLLVFDKNGKCLNYFTRACQRLLGRNPARENVVDLINYNDKETFKTWLNTLFEEPMPFEELLEFGPRFVPVSVDWTDPAFKHIGLEFFAMRADGKIENIVMVATDKTKEFQAGKESETQQNYINMLSKVLKDKASFVRFVGQFQSSMEEQLAKSNLDRLAFMRLVHSYKGMAGFLELAQLVEHLHQFENELSLDDYDGASLHERINRGVEILQQSLEQIRGFSPEILTPSQKLEVEEAKLVEFHKMLLPIDKDYAHSFKQNFMDWSIENYVEQYKTLVHDLAIKLDKKVNPLVIKNGDLKVDRKVFQAFFDSCIHLFRNCLDHGIEMPEKRLGLNKPESGTVTLTFDTKMISGKKYLSFEMKDDGAGISVEAIRKKLKKSNYPPEAYEETDDRIILSHIFDPEFSTTEVTTELSGRGIGLFDVKSIVEKFDGNIILETQPDHGTTFTFYLRFV